MLPHSYVGFPMPRYRLTIEYDGTKFYGWQVQADGKGNTVQGALETALKKLHDGAPVTLFCAGRTDSGVHAFAQVAHVDLPKKWGAFELCNAINGNVRPHLVSVIAAEEVGEDFHARFSATSRHYMYRILNRRAPPTIEVGKVWHVPAVLDSDQMHEAAQYLIGHHDFSTFRDVQCQAKSPVKTVDRFEVMRFDEMIEIHVKARSFLHQQVRSMVGSIKKVGDGRWRPIDVKHALDAKHRTACGPVAPSEGLYLVDVGYA
jgi:tRNA pseudouridine38-40 synthase